MDTIKSLYEILAPYPYLIGTVIVVGCILIIGFIMAWTDNGMMRAALIAKRKEQLKELFKEGVRNDRNPY